MESAPAATTDPAVHEALCKRCGKCCYRKIVIDDTVYITPFPCKYLDTRTNLCTIYPRRHQIHRSCLSVPQGLRFSAFPVDCAYVAALAPSEYRPAREDRDWSKEWHNFDALADDLDVPPAIRELIRARGPHAPPLYLEARRGAT